eukprot:TRINITY_DN1914_c0_g5_i2.p1 TRINITY_DN1914_c0_g5~~TRINITY_DN1914_c0_g5_i2.p1  ORF type:complete len:266 (+),score=87.92 TRINITY_DN1914_c0_g5_i2:58-855(+)
MQVSNVVVNPMKSVEECLEILKNLGFIDADFNTRVIRNFYKTDADWPLVVDIICRRNTAQNNIKKGEPQGGFKHSEEWKAKKLERLRHKQEKIKAEIARDECKLQWIAKVIDHVENGAQHPRFAEGGEETWRQMRYEMRQGGCHNDRRGCGDKDSWKQRKHEMKEERRRCKDAWRQRKHEMKGERKKCNDSSSEEDKNDSRQIWKQKKHEMKEERKRWKEANKCQRRSLKRENSSSSSSSEDDRRMWREMKKQWKQEKRNSCSRP